MELVEGITEKEARLENLAVATGSVSQPNKDDITDFISPNIKLGKSF